jgi:cellulose biosynthesis protein BcsQ
MRPNIISFSNQKGGVSKTTMTRLMGIHLAEAGKKNPAHRH